MPISTSVVEDVDDTLLQKFQSLFKEGTSTPELDELLYLFGETPSSLGLSFSDKTTSPLHTQQRAAEALEALFAPFAPSPPRPRSSLGRTANESSPTTTSLPVSRLAPEVAAAIFRAAPEPPPRPSHNASKKRPLSTDGGPHMLHMADVPAHSAIVQHPTQSRNASEDQIAHPAFAPQFVQQLQRNTPAPNPHRPLNGYDASHRKNTPNQFQRPQQHLQPLRRSVQQPRQMHQSQVSAPDNRPAAQTGPFRTAHAKLLQDRRRAGNRSGGNSVESGTSSRSGRARGDADGPTDLVPEGSLRAMGRAVLGPAKRPRFSAPRSNASVQQSQASKKDGTTRDDLPEIPNVEPRLVEMIMNEMLDTSPGVDWDDIAGLHFAKRCVMEAIVWPMKRPDIFTGLRGPPKGLMLFGPPGTGKTLIGRAIASKSGAKFFNISASSLMSKWVGEGEKMVRALFAVARVFQPSVVFIDEIDSLLTQRTDSDQESSRRVKTEFLVQMDGAGTSREDRVLVVGATNRPQELDEAARRRLVKRLYIPLPDDAARKSMVKRLLEKQTNCCTEQDFEAIVNVSKGYSGSDMYALCAEAALGPVRDLGEAIGSIDADSVRPINKGDFLVAARMVRASVSTKDLDGYVSWNESYGSFPMTDPKAAT